MNRPPEADTPVIARLRALRKAAPDFVARQVKTVRQARYGWLHPRRVAFVFGCQRSGTKMVMRILENSPATRIYHENHTTAFHDFQLRPDPVLRALIEANPAPAQIFKPICDSQRADELLARFPDARALWVYRHPDDVANSAAVKWGEHQRDVVAAVARGDFTSWGWRTERLADTTVAAVRSVYREDLTPAEGALLFWYLRNSFFFTLGLDQEPRVLLVRYEDLVRTPKSAFARMFAHVRVPFDDAFVARVRTDSIRRREPPPASPAIRALCDGLQKRLDAVMERDRRPPRRVLMLINTLGVGGAERYVVTASNWLAARGDTVSVAASEGGELQPDLRPDVRFRPLPLRRVRTALPVVAAQLARMLDEKPDVVVAHSLAVTWVARVADPLHHVPIVNIAHGWPAERYARVGPLMRVADRVVAVSPDVKARLVAAGLPAERCDVVHNGVDLGGLGPRTGAVREAARAVMGAGAEHLLVVTVGRLAQQKAQHHVVTLAARLRDVAPALRWAIVGAGEREDELREAIRAAGVEDRVTLTGLRSDVPDLLGSADVYLSCSDWEGMSLTIIEAMAARLPIVATRTEGSAELLTDACAIVVPVGDVDAMGDAIAALVADPERRARLGEAAATRARASFGHDRMMEELSAVIERVITPGR